jgi:hypothetical protein
MRQPTVQRGEIRHAEQLLQTVDLLRAKPRWQLAAQLIEQRRKLEYALRVPTDR